MKRGTTLKFSEAGLDWLSGGLPRQRDRLAAKRFEFGGRARIDRDCISVKPVGKKYWARYHKSFLEEDRKYRVPTPTD